MTILADDCVLQRALDRSLVSTAQLESARLVVSRHANAGALASRLLDHLIEAKVLSRWQVACLWAEELGFEVVELENVIVPEEIVAAIPVVMAERHLLMPLSRKNGILRVAVSDPLDASGADTVGHLLGGPVEMVVARAEEIARTIQRHYGGVPSASATDHDETFSDLGITPTANPDESVETAASSPNDGPVIARVHEIIREAVARRASDVHWEPFETRFRVRYRIDGVLVEAKVLPREQRAATVSRIKIMANISIAQKRVPQDGRIALTLDGRPIDLRVATCPTVHGEGAVMRVLSRENASSGLAGLELDPENQAILETLIGRPDGIVLVTGPTGSGKTTTLYGCLQHLNQSQRKIITVEDPIEYQLGGINQVPVRPEIGLTFAAALRAMLRQAPNVVMVGEIRDRETADIAIQAALTGHLVFSTLHTNDAPGALIRLIEIGVKPFLLASSVRGVVAQRLVRKICPECSRPHRPAPEELAALGLDPAAGAGHFRRGAGCPACDGTGFRGRLGIFEIFVINEELQQLIHERADVRLLREKARALGMRTLREDGARKVSAGLTTAGEVVSITAGDARHFNPPDLL